MKSYEKGLALGACLLPLLCKIPYLARCWRQSPLDRTDWVFWVLPILLCGIRFRKIRPFWQDKADLRGFYLLCPVLLCYAAAMFIQINTLQIACAVLILFAGIWVVAGSRMFTFLSPLLFIFLLGCPSTSYWVEYFFRDLAVVMGVGGTFLKMLAALFPAGCFLFWARDYSLSTFFFLSFLLSTLLTLLLMQTSQNTGHGLNVDTNRRKIGTFLACRQPPTPADQGFFGRNKAIRINYFSELPNPSSIELLKVKVEGNLHSIHPPELCLKSGGSTILALKERLLETTAGNLAFQEILFRAKQQDYLMYAWYSTKEYSTGNFLKFRSRWQRSGNWTVTQVVTPVSHTQADAELVLRRFLDSSLWNSTPARKEKQ